MFCNILNTELSEKSNNCKLFDFIKRGIQQWKIGSNGEAAMGLY